MSREKKRIAEGEAENGPLAVRFAAFAVGAMGKTRNVMLAVHCKTSESVELVEPLREYITLNYGDAQAADSNDDLEEVATLRREVINQTGSLTQLRDKLAK